jgi:crotonobetainyl-CoA:carnitine CoA-transferase CaiB-like acyl-CoA transferase
VQTTDEVLADPQVLAAGGLVEVPEGDSSVMMINTSVDFVGTPGGPRAMPPELGEHTDAILGELGHDAAEIERLRHEGVVA